LGYELMKNLIRNHEKNLVINLVNILCTAFGVALYYYNAKKN